MWFPDQFIAFLEACIASEGVTEKADLYTTLFEIYLHKASNTQAEEKTEWERKARTVDLRMDINDLLWCGYGQRTHLDITRGPRDWASCAISLAKESYLRSPTYEHHPAYHYRLGRSVITASRGFPESF